MTKTIHNAILQLCIHQLQKSMQQNYVVIIYTYDFIALYAPRSLHQTSLTYNYDYTRNLSATSDTHTTNNSNTSTNLTTLALEHELADTTNQNSTNYDYHYDQPQVHSYGYRYYNPELGRWINRDPIEHLRSYLWLWVNMSDSDIKRIMSKSIEPEYVFILNQVMVHWDYLGLDTGSSLDTCISDRAMCDVACSGVGYGQNLQCYDDCRSAYNNCIQGVVPPSSIPSLPRTSPECDKYGCDDKYAGASAKCFCKCADDGEWSSFVRGCLRSMYEQGVEPHTAHTVCYHLADSQNFDGGRPWLTLAYCYQRCVRNDDYP